MRIAVSLLGFLAASLLLAAPLSAQSAVERLEKKFRDGDEREYPSSTGPAPGYLGAVLDDKEEEGKGVRVKEVDEGSPAAKAGLAVDDLLTALGGEPIRDLNGLAEMLQGLGPGDKIELTVERNGRPRKLTVTLAPRPEAKNRRFEEFGRIPEEQELPVPEGEEPAGDGPAGDGSGREERAAAPPKLGVLTMPVNAAIAERLGLPSVRGALVDQLVVGSAADKAGLPLQAVIVGANGIAIDTPDDLAAVLKTRKAGDTLDLSYYVRGTLRKLKVRLDAGGGPDETQPPPRRAPKRRNDPDPPEIEPPQPEDEPSQDASRTELLERRIEELERRVAELERALRAEPDDES